MRWKVLGRDPESGEQRVMEVEARGHDDAAEAARRQGLEVRSVEALEDIADDLPPGAAEARRMSRGRSLMLRVLVIGGIIVLMWAFFVYVWPGGTW